MKQPSTSGVTVNVWSGVRLKMERESFGLVLRVGRERRKVTLEQLAAETKVRPEIWTALEENDLSRFPTGIYGRNLVRAYARRVDLDSDELVNEFCRLFPNGDRRTDRLLRQYSALVGNGRPGRQEWPSPRRRAGDGVPPPFWRALLRADLRSVVAAGAGWLRTRRRLERLGRVGMQWRAARHADGQV